MKFNYQARTKTGEAQSGTIEASSREAAVSLLQGHGLYVTILEETGAVPFYARRIAIFERVSGKEVVMFARQLSIMFKSKIPLVEALQVLAVQTKNLGFREKILEISDDVKGGAPLSQALSRYPEVFSSFFVSTVKAGEAAGTLSDGLSYLADHLEREYHFASRVKGAMIYPALIVLVVFGVLAMMIFFVIPQLAKVLEETGQDLPLLTKVVIGFSNFARQWGWLVTIFLVGAVVAVFRYAGTIRGKAFLGRVYLKIPLLGALLKMIYLARFAENLSTLISGGLPIGEALEITGEIVGNDVYKKVIFLARDEVRTGETISSVLSRFPEIFPPLFIQMTMVGEKTGSLDKTLKNVVDFYQKEVERSLADFLNILEPLLIIFLGIVVAGIMAAVLMPLYKMTSI